MSQPLIKFCGMRRHEDIALANVYSPNYIGLIFAPSKRQVAPELAAALISQLDPTIKAVGVFVDEKPEKIAAIARMVGLAVVQLHGHEGRAEWNSLRELLPPGVEIWQKLSIPVDASFAARRVADYEQMMTLMRLPDARPTVWLLDTELDGQSGGTGITFPWALLHEFAQNHRVACAGGLNPDNVATAINAMQPAIVDCSSGIERNLEKQADLMQAFCQTVRQTERT
ncbi:MAG: phosphoribosylanthranilate isomerase [Eubacteriales bacterium]|nr:phosphoribosylanthranilate isomerase [Eubacteriales bacterium]